MPAGSVMNWTACSMAKTRAGDFRNREHVERFARTVAATLGHAPAVGR